MSDSSGHRPDGRRFVSWLRHNPLTVSFVAVAVVALAIVAALLGPALARPASLSAGRPTPAPTDSAGAAADVAGDPSDTPSAAPGDGSLGSAGPSPSPSTGKGGGGTAWGQPPSASGFPAGTNTGVPGGTNLTAYSGPCTITAAGTVIEAKTVNCSLSIRAKGVVIKRSKVNGTINSNEGDPFSFTLEESEVDAGLVQAAAVGTTNMTVRRTNVHGGATSIYCFANCDIRDSYLHGQRIPAGVDWHLGAFLANDNGVDPGGRTNVTLVHNTIVCDPPPTSADGGCSGDVNLFGDFGPISYVTVDNNMLGASTGLAYCVFGGSSSGKKFEADHVVFVNNVFSRGANSKCGNFGPVTAFDASRPGNQWANNVWDDRSPVRAER